MIILKLNNPSDKILSLQTMDVHYETFMKNLTPCSSNLTFNDDLTSYNPIDFNKLLSERNELKKSGTLVDDELKVDGVNLECDHTDKQTDSGESIKLVYLDNNKCKYINLQSIIDFIFKATNKTLSKNQLNVNHLIIYLGHENSTIDRIKLCHLGRIYCINSMLNLASKDLLLQDLKVHRFPTIQLLRYDYNPVADSLRKMLIKDILNKTFEVEHYNVTYADALVHKFRTKRKFKLIRRLLRV